MVEGCFDVQEIVDVGVFDLILVLERVVDNAKALRAH
jgi:hypothetical protein